MTTPAIDYDRVFYGCGTRRYFRPPSNLVSTSSICDNYAIEHQSRPESQNSPIVNGFRMPTAWVHTGCKMKRAPTSSLVIESPSFGGDRTEISGIPAAWNQMAGTGRTVLRQVPINLVNRAQTAALLKLKDQKLNIGVFIGEGRQTLNLIATNLNRITGTVRNFRRKFPDLFRRAQRYAGQGRNKIPSAWLEVQYGWKPLLNDICGGIDEMHRLSLRTGALVHVIGRARDTTEVNHFVGARVNPPAGKSAGWTVREQIEDSVKCRLDYQLSLPALQRASQLGLTNPLEIAWELVPFSFVVDWVVPIGQWISTLDAGLGYTFKAGSTSLMAKSTDSSGGAHGYEHDGATISCRGTTTLFEKFNFVRTVHGTPPSPGLYYRNPFTVTRALNAIALLAVIFGRR